MDWTIAGFIATAAGFIATTIALVVGFVSSSRISMRLGRLEERDEQIILRLERLEERDKEMIRMMSDISLRISETFSDISRRLEVLSERTEIPRVLANLNERVWPSYLRFIQSQAMSYQPSYLEPRAGKRELTEDGRRLLDDELTVKIEKLVTSEPSLAANDVIFQLNIYYLHNKAREKKVPLDVMIAGVHAYLEEVRESVKK